jgi:hypothetical protein
MGCAGVCSRVYLLSMRHGFSHYMRLQAIADARSVLSFHAHAFAYFSGMLRQVTYGSAEILALEHSRTVVTSNDAPLDFAGRFVFRPRLCHPARHETEGKIECMIGYAKDSGSPIAPPSICPTWTRSWWPGSRASRCARVRDHRRAPRRPAVHEGLAPFAAAKPWCSVAALPSQRPLSTLLRCA